jgi:hypothetical protein
MFSTAFLLAASMVVGQAEAASPLPQDVAAHFQYLIGNWHVEGKVGDTIVQGTYSVRWAPGRHCLLVTWTPDQDQPKEGSAHMSGVIGYDWASNQTIENNFWSNGDHYTIRYDVSTPVRARGTINGELTCGSKEKQHQCQVKIERKGREEYTYVGEAPDGSAVEAVFRRAEFPGRRKPQPKQD